MSGQSWGLTEPAGAEGHSVFRLLRSSPTFPAEWAVTEHFPKIHWDYSTIVVAVLAVEAVFEVLAAETALAVAASVAVQAVA